MTRARILAHSGNGGVASLTSDTSCVHDASAKSARETLRRISGSNRALGSFALSAEGGMPRLWATLRP